MLFAFSTIIAFVESGDPYEWRGYLYAVLMFLVGVAGVAFNQNQFNILYTTGMRVRTGITTALYRKVLPLLFCQILIDQDIFFFFGNL